MANLEPQDAAEAIALAALELEKIPGWNFSTMGGGDSRNAPGQLHDIGQAWAAEVATIANWDGEYIEAVDLYAERVAKFWLLEPGMFLSGNFPHALAGLARLSIREAFDNNHRKEEFR